MTNPGTALFWDYVGRCAGCAVLNYFIPVGTIINFLLARPDGDLASDIGRWGFVAEIAAEDLQTIGEAAEVVLVSSLYSFGGWCKRFLGRRGAWAAYWPEVSNTALLF